jgi:SWI/SNF-related matrix-associated actin-dependent regulator 1 of chromatin subfamily A
VTELYKFQKKGVRKIQHFGGRALLADDPGLGKTIQSLTWCQQNIKEGPVVVVCPASVKYNWEREAATHIGWRAEVLSGMTAPKSPRAVHPARLYVVNYRILGAWLDWLGNIKPRCVVIDECQAISNPKTIQSKCVKKLTAGVPHVLALSGTPLTNRPKELYPVLNILRRDVWPAFLPFAFDHCNPKKTIFGWNFNGAANLDSLHKKLNKYCMIRRRKRDVLQELPAKRLHVVPVEVENRREYDTARADLIGWLRANGKRTRGALAAERLVKMGHLKRLAGWLKVKTVIDWLKNFLYNSEGKIIVFVVHKLVINELMKNFGRVAVKIDGSTPTEERLNLIDKSKMTKTRGCSSGTSWRPGPGGTGRPPRRSCSPNWTGFRACTPRRRTGRTGSARRVVWTFIIWLERELLKRTCARYYSLNRRF